MILLFGQLIMPNFSLRQRQVIKSLILDCEFPKDRKSCPVCIFPSPGPVSAPYGLVAKSDEMMECLDSHAETA